MVELYKWFQNENLFYNEELIQIIVDKCKSQYITNIEALKAFIALDTSMLVKAGVCTNHVQKLINEKLHLTKSLSLLSIEDLSHLVKNYFPSLNYYLEFEKNHINGSILVDLTSNSGFQSLITNQLIKKELHAKAFMNCINNWMDFGVLKTSLPYENHIIKEKDVYYPNETVISTSIDPLLIATHYNTDKSKLIKNSDNNLHNQTEIVKMSNSHNLVKRSQENISSTASENDSDDTYNSCMLSDNDCDEQGNISDTSNSIDNNIMKIIRTSTIDSNSSLLLESKKESKPSWSWWLPEEVCILLIIKCIIIIYLTRTNKLSFLGCNVIRVCTII